MEIAHPPPVQAVVLARPSRNAQSGIVLIARRRYDKYEEYRAVNDITEADHLAASAKVRAQSDFPRWKFVGPAVVYDYNPTDKPLEGLKAGRSFGLQLKEDREELDNNTPLHGHQDPDTREVVDTFFVLVTAFDPAVRRINGKQLVDCCLSEIVRIIVTNLQLLLFIAFL